MGNTQIGGAIHHLCRTLLPDGAGPTDAQLLTDYLDRRDEASLATVVHRHGPMVWGVCRRVLGDHHAAEDAFQAAFLVLVRKAASVAPRERLANWLYGVAHQTALKARATAAKRNRREKQVTQMPEPIATKSNVWPDLQPVLDEELSRLPDKYRAVIVLCDLEDRTRAEAARHLGVPEGSVAGWLARGRAMLAERLTRRGVSLSTAALAGALSRSVASAGAPPSVLASTIRAASLFAADPATTGAISVPVAALTEGVLKAMFLAKLKVSTAVLLVALLACSSVGLHAFDLMAAEPPEKNVPKQDDPPKADAKTKHAAKAAMTAEQRKVDSEPFPFSARQAGYAPLDLKQIISTRDAVLLSTATPESRLIKVTTKKHWDAFVEGFAKVDKETGKPLFVTHEPSVGVKKADFVPNFDNEAVLVLFSKKNPQIGHSQFMDVEVFEGAGQLKAYAFFGPKDHEEGPLPQPYNEPIQGYFYLVTVPRKFAEHPVEYRMAEQTWGRPCSTFSPPFTRPSKVDK